MVGVKFAYVLAIFTLFGRLDATLIDRLNELMAGQEKIQQELKTGEQELKAGQQELKAELKTDQEELQEKVEEISDAVNFLARANLTGLNGVGEKLNDVKEKIDEVLFQITKEGNGTGGHGTGGNDLVQRLIVIGNGKAKWDGAVIDGQGGRVEDAFSTSAGNDDYGCAGYQGAYTIPFPIMVWYEFASRHVPARFSFRQISNSESPKGWNFVGSKDEGCSHASTWKTLCGGNKKPVRGEEVGCDVPKNLREPFKCLGISVYSTDYKRKNSVCLKAMRFWEYTPSV